MTSAAKSRSVLSRPAARKPVDYGELRSLLGFGIRVAQIAIFKDFHASTDGLGLTPAGFSVLELLHCNPGITQSRLAHAVHLDRSSLVPLLDRLQQRGLVRREASTADRRHNHLFLSSSGTALRNAAMKRVRAHDRRMSARLSDAERRRLFELIAKLG